MELIDLRNKLPRTVAASQRRALNKITAIVVHHTGDNRIWPDRTGALNWPHSYDPIKQYTQEANYHIQKDWGGGYHGNGIQYHYIINRAGLAYRTRDVEEIIWHATNANPFSVSICLDGDLTKQEPTIAQLTTLQALVEELRAWLKVDRSKVYGHGELKAYGNATQCPGSALKYVIEYRDTGKIAKVAQTEPQTPNKPLNPAEYEGQSLKAPNGATYHISYGKKILSPDALTFVSHGFLLKDIKPVSQAVIDTFPDGGQMDYAGSKYQAIFDDIRAHKGEFRQWFS